MKKILLVCALGLFALGASAQEVAKKPSFKGFVNNGFWDNWEITVGGGMNYVGYNGVGFSGQNNSGDCVGWALEGSATKWFNPVVGARVQLIGGRLNMSDGKGGEYKNNYIMPHVDAMVNLSNWIGGYREDRVYYATVFGGAGANFIDVKEDAGKGLAVDFGLVNTFRIAPRFDLNLELKTIMLSSHDMPQPIYNMYKSGDEISQIYSATIGLTYRFNKRGWERGVPGYTAEDIKAFQDAVAAGAAAAAAAEADKAKLAKQLKDAEAARDAALADADAAARDAAAAREAAAKKKDAPMIVLYDINAATLSPKEKTRLDLMADMIKNGPKDRVYNLEGHADKQTGSAAFNQKVSDQRAKAAYDYLVKKGVNPDQLTYKGYGDVQNPYPAVQKANRSVIIK
ncbi:MAG: OmpA family protein [Alistipes sp.]|nr:OmpA family protein [Alistipes sp.]MBR3847611.1 OmpA family protein [Alistipes sp.]MBR7169842.1 OmpA family protein [Alistipes sp.]